ncbi:MAG: hypothetical protein IJ468_12415 [Lachnospiraceae bacterium]|nr:hypothetical protein [Lachnospiraceae bacterium]
MAYKKQFLSIEEAKKQINGFQYALVYQLESVLLGSIDQMSDQIIWEECIEARFFSQEHELHIFEFNGEYRAVLVSDDGKQECESIVRCRKLEDRYRKLGWSELLVKEYIGFDEDGQAYTALTRLVGLQ